MLGGGHEGQWLDRLATPRVFYYDRPTEIYWDGGTVDWDTGDTLHDSQSLPVDGQIKKSEWLDGALMARVAAILDIEFLDERVFLYFEDAEWSVRAARLAGSTPSSRERALGTRYREARGVPGILPSASITLGIATCS